MKKHITICGGGNLGHVCAGVLGSIHHVSLLTTHPERWTNGVMVTAPGGKVYHGVLERVSSHAEEVIPQADIVLLCLPGFAIHDVLQQIMPHLRADTWVGTVVSSTGFFFEALELLPESQVLFGFQRVPFISRLTEYGSSAQLKGYKSSLSVAVEHCDDKEEVRSTLEQLFSTPTLLLHSYYEVSLSNSNPLLHTARLYTMWHKWSAGTIYPCNPYFYADWTTEASSLLITMDEEFQRILRAIGLPTESIPPVLTYYESHDAESLTKKIRSIAAFQGILSPMKKIGEEGYVPDFTSRYFTEDFPYGMRFIVETAARFHIGIPTIERVYAWGSQATKYVFSD